MENTEINTTVEETQQETTQPEGNGTQSERTFTQDEVNRIVSERLSRERAKTETIDTNDFEAREAELKRRENIFSCKEYLAGEKLPHELIDVFGTDDVEKFKSNVEKIRPLLHDPNAPSITTGVRSGGNSYEGDPFKEAFGLASEEKR